MYAVTQSLPLSHSYPCEMSRCTRIALHILDAPTMLKSTGDDVYEHGVVSKSRDGEIVCRPYVIYTMSYYITYQAVQDIGRSQCGGGVYHIVDSRHWLRVLRTKLIRFSHRMLMTVS